MVTIPAKMRAAKGAFHSKAMKLPGVHATSIGFKHVAGKPIQTPAILIHVAKKKAPGDLSPQELIPKEIDGFPTDVIEDEPMRLLAAASQPASALPDEEKYRPMLGGVQIQGGQSIGTLGCGVRDRKTKTPYVLSCQHVLGNEDDWVGQPSASSGDYIGKVIKSVLDNYMDCAISGIGYYDDAVQGRIRAPDGDWTVMGSSDIAPSDGQPSMEPTWVKKRGRTSGVTQGTIFSLYYSTTVKFPDGTTHDFDDQLCLKPTGGSFVMEGDSGSVLLDRDNKVIGLVFMGSPSGNAGATPIQWILDALEVDVIVGKAE